MRIYLSLSCDFTVLDGTASAVANVQTDSVALEIAGGLCDVWVAAVFFFCTCLYFCSVFLVIFLRIQTGFVFLFVFLVIFLRIQTGKFSIFQPHLGKLFLYIFQPPFPYANLRVK